MSVIVDVGIVIGFILNVVAVLGIYSKLTIMGYQHSILWQDYVDRKQIKEPQK